MSADYYYRRRLSAKDVLPAIGAGIAAGLAGFYVVQLLIQRTPLVPEGKLLKASRLPERDLDAFDEEGDRTLPRSDRVRGRRLTGGAMSDEVPDAPSPGPVTG